MSSSSSKKYKGVRQRKWGKWVSEIRVPGSPERLWLGTYATPEAAAVAHDVAFYCLRGPHSLHKLNFPDMLPSSCVQLQQSRPDMSPRSAQAAASEAGMAVDAKNIIEADGRNNEEEEEEKDSVGEEEEGHDIIIQSDDWWDDDEDGGNYKGYTNNNREGGALNISIDDYIF